MRINDRNAADSAAAPTGRALETQRSEAAASNKSGLSGEAGGDRVDLSNLANRLSRALDALAVERSRHVERVSADFHAGRYQVDALAVSRAMVAEALSPV